MKGFLVSAVAVAGGLALITNHSAVSHKLLSSALNDLHAQRASSGGAAQVAVAYAKAQLGKPYVFGAAGPDAFDCSGLAMEAWRHAGVTIPRRSQDQWAKLPHIPASQRDPGDLVFFAGSDGTPASPGHVGVLVSRNQMAEAYMAGVPIRIVRFGKPSSPLGDQNVVGYADPAGG
jgi:cell wall-associated NlpC family hydrolase